ncbi:IclR family transcriptional regulator [Sinomonas cyclohexanicum]|uniref:IclR family transcriptional regulator n=1 Tax=Sinomonas cyclohexanicum TaxID=322009 RepID=A0ABM7Q0W7_SINCY|nr:IclR family transcriptional regulator C-terminal domain-containing protein [Corynebacterium cyclohexanicum]BCT78216.1 IclR family transcriptional regulator [Corynebacterium cyclohexanicum]
MSYRSDSKPSAAVNAIRVLETVARFGTGTTAKEVTDTLHMAQATAYRVLNSLVADEFLARTSDLRGFALGHAISGLITAATPPTVPTAARNEIEKFRAGNRFAVHLVMFRNAALRVADEDPDYPVRSVFEMLRNPHASAAGKLMLAHLEERESLFPGGPLVRVTGHTIADHARLKEELAEIRSKGEAVEINELEEGSASLAVPVTRPSGSVGAAVCLTGSAERFDSICEHAESARALASRLAPLLF